MFSQYLLWDTFQLSLHFSYALSLSLSLVAHSACVFDVYSYARPQTDGQRERVREKEKDRRINTELACFVSSILEKQQNKEDELQHLHTFLAGK